MSSRHLRSSNLFSNRTQVLGLLLLLSVALEIDAGPTKAKKPASHPASFSDDASSKSNLPLDTASVRRFYMDGDFDPAIDLIETALLYKSGFTHQDSVFMYKHLGVMYAAKYETREKGKLYMHKLLEVEPTARIMDMYASDMIYMIFKNIQDEVDTARRRHLNSDTTSAEPIGRTNESMNDNKQKAGSSSLVWIGATATVLAAAGVAAWYYFSDEPEVKDHNP